jgi:hypothetical protein
MWENDGLATYEISDRDWVHKKLYDETKGRNVEVLFEKKYKGQVIGATQKFQVKDTQQDSRYVFNTSKAGVVRAVVQFFYGFRMYYSEDEWKNVKLLDDASVPFWVRVPVPPMQKTKTPKQAKPAKQPVPWRFRVYVSTWIIKDNSFQPHTGEAASVQTQFDQLSQFAQSTNTN